MTKCKIFTKRLFQVDTSVLEHTLYPCVCFATCRIPMEQYNRQKSYQSDQLPIHVQADLPVCVAPEGSTCKLNT